jgi:hypothetical protein
MLRRVDGVRDKYNDEQPKGWMDLDMVTAPHFREALSLYFLFL